MKIFQKNELKILLPFYLESFLAFIIQFVPAFALIYFISIGMDIVKIGFLMAMVPLASLIFEVPTGAIADIYGSVTKIFFRERFVVSRHINKINYLSVDKNARKIICN